MNRWKLFLMLRKQNSLAIRRSPAFEQSVVARVMMVIGAGFMIFYLIFLGVVMAMPAAESHHYTILLAMVPLWLTIDFGMRFAVQQTPSVVAKPYLLQPMPFLSVVETYLVNSLITGYNLTWLSLYVPYAIIIFFGGASFFSALSVIICGLLLTMSNSQFYLMVRTLCGRSLLWWFLPVLVYGGFWLLLPIDADLFDKQMDFLCDFT